MEGDEQGQNEPAARPVAGKVLQKSRRSWLLFFSIIFASFLICSVGLFFAWPGILRKSLAEVKARWGIELSVQQAELQLFPVFVARLTNVRLNKMPPVQALDQVQPAAVSPVAPELAVQLGKLDFSFNWQELRHTNFVAEQLALEDLQVEIGGDTAGPTEPQAGGQQAQEPDAGHKTWEDLIRVTQKALAQLRGSIRLGNFLLKNMDFVRRDAKGNKLWSARLVGATRLSFLLDAALPHSQKKLSNLYGYAEQADELREFRMETKWSADPGSVLYFDQSTVQDTGAVAELNLQTKLSGHLVLKMLWPEDQSQPIQVNLEQLAGEVAEWQGAWQTSPASAQSQTNRTVGLKLGKSAFSIQGALKEVNKGCSIFLLRDDDELAAKLEPCLLSFELAHLTWKDSLLHNRAADAHDAGAFGVLFSLQTGQSLQLSASDLQTFRPASLPPVASRLVVSQSRPGTETPPQQATELLQLDFTAAQNAGRWHTSLAYFFQAGKLLELASLTGLLDAHAQKESAQSKLPLTRSQLRGELKLDFANSAIPELLKMKQTAAEQTGDRTADAALLRVAALAPKIAMWAQFAFNPKHPVPEEKRAFEEKNSLSGEGVSLDLAAALKQDVFEADLHARAQLQSMKSKFPYSLKDLQLNQRVRVAWATSQIPKGRDHALGKPQLLQEIGKMVQDTPLAMWLKKPIQEFEYLLDLNASGLALAQDPLQEHNLGELERVRAAIELTLDSESNAELEYAKILVYSRLRKAVVPLLEGSLNGRIGGQLDEGFAEGRIKLNFPAQAVFPAVADLFHIKGKIDFPFKIVYSGLDVRAGANSNLATSRPNAEIRPNVLLNARAQVENLDFAQVKQQSGAEILALKNLNGQFPVEQQLALIPLKGDALPFQISWQPVLVENPFRRADGQRLAGLYSSGKNMTLQELSFGKWRLGPAAAALALKQNQFIVDSLDAEILGGVLTGQAAVSVQPSRPTLGFSGRVSQLDGGKLLGVTGLTQADSALNARTAFVYNFKEALVEGRADVDRIPRPLLERTLARLDPSGVDSKIALARQALQLAAPGKMGVQMHDGFAALSLEFVTLGQSVQTIRIPALPLTRLLESRTAAWRQGLENALPEEQELDSPAP